MKIKFKTFHARKAWEFQKHNFQEASEQKISTYLNL
jgi:hypothetical protein